MPLWPDLHLLQYAKRPHLLRSIKHIVDQFYCAVNQKLTSIRTNQIALDDCAVASCKNLLFKEMIYSVFTGENSSPSQSSFLNFQEEFQQG
jgi:hypothetical protein